MNTNSSRYVGTHLTWFLGRGPLVGGSHYKWVDPDGKTWHDGGAESRGEGTYASGLPYNTPGIALPVHATLRQWCRISMPRQNITVVLRHVDIGPHSEPVLDITAMAAFLLFTSQGRFPDYTPWVVEPLGLELPEGVTASLTNLRTGSVTPVPDTL